MSGRAVLAATSRIGGVSLTVSDLAGSLDFYSRTLGLEVTQEATDTWLATTGDEPLLRLVGDANAPPRPARSTGLYHLALLLPDRASLARILRRLIQRRYPLTGVSDHGVSEALYLDDPEGNGIELYQDRPRATWRDRQGRVAMFTEPLDVEGLLTLAPAAEMAPGLPPGTRIGHIHLVVSDLATAERFYCDLLGFVEEARYGPVALFVAAGGYHHHVGLNVFAGTGFPPPPPGARGLREFELVLPDIAELERVAARLDRGGVVVTRDQGGARLADPFGNHLRLAVRP